VRITYFGVRGSCPCSSDQQRRYGGNTSCVLVEVDDEPPLVLDMGTGLRALGHRLNADLVPVGRPLRGNMPAELNTTLWEWSANNFFAFNSA